MTITLNYTFYKNITKKQGIVHREFLKGGTLSIDRLLSEVLSEVYSKDIDMILDSILLLLQGEYTQGQCMFASITLGHDLDSLLLDVKISYQMIENKA